MRPECTSGNSARYFLTADDPRIAIEDVALVTDERMLPRKYKARLVTKIIRVGGEWHDRDHAQIARIRTDNKQMHPLGIV